MSARGWGWPAAIVGLLVASAGANIGFMIVANRDASFAVEPDYYRKAVEWDLTMAQRATNAALGWQVSMQLEPGAADRARLVLRVRDGAGAPLTGATVEAEAFPSARAREVRSLVLVPSGDGAYAADLAGARPGLWEVRVVVTHDSRRFTQTLNQELARAEGVVRQQAAGAPAARASRPSTP